MSERWWGRTIIRVYLSSTDKRLAWLNSQQRQAFCLDFKFIIHMTCRALSDRFWGIIGTIHRGIRSAPTAPGTCKWQLHGVNFYSQQQLKLILKSNCRTSHLYSKKIGNLPETAVSQHVFEASARNFTARNLGVQVPLHSKVSVGLGRLHTHTNAQNIPPGHY